MNRTFLKSHSIRAVAALVWIVCGLAMLVAQGRTAAAAAPVDAHELNKRLGRGVNIVGWDPIWQDRAKGHFKAEHLKLIHEAGFQHVRVNLHPLRDGKPDAQGKLRDEFFKTLDFLVDEALANKLLVILDYHDDLAISPDPEGKKKEYLASWAAIAEHFKDRPSEVLFELLNEPAGKFTQASWNEYYREALAVVRKSNPNRIVIVGPANWNGIGEIDKLQLPEDDQNLIATVHYYNPFDFTHQGTPWTGNANKSGVTWTGSEAERQAVVREFGKVKAWADQHKRPIYIGEFGAYETGDMASRVRWTSFVAREIERQGFSWGYWQFADNFKLFDYATGKWVEPIRDALIPK